jgi:hypothetical protein
VGCAGTLRAPPAAKGPGGEGIEGLANAPTAHDPCIELDVGRGRCLDGELNGCGYCDMFVVGKIDRRMFQRAVYATLRWGRCSSMMKASTLCAISAGSAALCLASTLNVVCAAIYTAMVISSGWSLKNLSSCSDNACKALSASRTISFRRWRVGSAPKQPILLPPCREVIVCL